MVSDPLFNAAFHRSPIGQYLLAPTDKLEILALNDAFLRSLSAAGSHRGLRHQSRLARSRSCKYHGRARAETHGLSTSTS
jgi:hypothetical protein